MVGGTGEYVGQGENTTKKCPIIFVINLQVYICELDGRIGCVKLFTISSESIRNNYLFTVIYLETFEVRVVLPSGLEVHNLHFTDYNNTIVFKLPPWVIKTLCLFPSRELFILT